MQLNTRICPLRGSAALRSSRSERGAALVFALAAVLITSFLIFGVSQLCTQDNILSQRQQDAAASLNAAEAAFNWELGKVTRWSLNPTLGGNGPDQIGSPYTGPIPGVNGGPGVQGTVTVYVESSGGADWVPPGPGVIVASATVNGITRTVAAGINGVSACNAATLYGVNTLTLNGANVFLQGTIGTAGTCTVGAAGSLNGTVEFDKKNGIQGNWGGAAPAWDWVYAPLETPFPTVNQIAMHAVPLWPMVVTKPPYNTVTDPPLGYFRVGSDNAAWIKARGSDGNLYPITWPAGDPQHVRLDDALFAANTDPKPSDPKVKLQSIVLIGNGTKRPDGFRKGSNFYFEYIELTGQNTLEIQNNSYDTTLWATGCGPVRLWLGPGGSAPVPGAKFDFLDGNLLVDWNDPSTETDPGAFILYNASRTPIRLGKCRAQDTATPAHQGFYGSIYSYNADAGGEYGSVEIRDNFTLRGSIVARDLAQTGGVLDARLPSNAGSSTDFIKYVLFYRTTVQWIETDTAGNLITPDSQTGNW
jgi:hypothetical protein